MQQLAFLKAKGCDEAQGYLIGKAMDADGFAAFVADYSPDEILRAIDTA